MRLFFSTVVTSVFLLEQALAQATTSLWLLGKYNYPIGGSIITSDATAATWTLSCGSNAPGCSLPTSLTVTEGPSTLAYSYSLENDYLFKVACQVTSSISSGDCTLTLQSKTESSVRTTTVGPDVLSQVPVTITAGPGATSKAPLPSSTTAAPGPYITPYPTPGPTYVASVGNQPKYANMTMHPTSGIAQATGATTSSSSAAAKPTKANAANAPYSLEPILGLLAAFAGMLLV